MRGTDAVAKPAGPLLQVDGVDVFRGQAHILADVAFSVGRDEVVALIGRNGAGKSTTLKAIIGLLPPASGRILFDGAPIEGASPHVVSRRGIGYVPEERRIFSELTVQENLAVGRQPPRAGAPSWTLDAVFRLFPILGELRRRVAGRMSGGEQQMLAIARTLMGNPSLLLLDEPCEGLAPKIVADVADTIRRLKAEGVAVLLAEQNRRFAERVADRAVLLERGRVRYEGGLAGLPDDSTAAPVKRCASWEWTQRARRGSMAALTPVTGRKLDEGCRHAVARAGARRLRATDRHHRPLRQQLWELV